MEEEGPPWSSQMTETPSAVKAVLIGEVGGLSGGDEIRKRGFVGKNQLPPD